MAYKYGMRLRGFAPMCQPKGTVNRMDDPSGKYYDIITYDRELTEKELSDYELDYIGVTYTDVWMKAYDIYTDQNKTESSRYNDMQTYLLEMVREGHINMAEKSMLASDLMEAVNEY